MILHTIISPADVLYGAQQTKDPAPGAAQDSILTDPQRILQEERNRNQNKPR